MATEILLPKLGFSMNEGVLSEWLVADGGSVKEGEPLFALGQHQGHEWLVKPCASAPTCSGADHVQCDEPRQGALPQLLHELGLASGADR